MLRYYTTDIVNVRMVITEEKILSNIDKIHKMINPNSKKQMVQLSQDKTYKELIESVRVYVNEYPNKGTFPTQIYVESFKLVQYATALFEQVKKQLALLETQKEQNVIMANIIKNLVNLAVVKDIKIKEAIVNSLIEIPEETIKDLSYIFKCQNPSDEQYCNILKKLKIKVANLESSVHIEVDFERLEDRLNALKLIGNNLATCLKDIPLTEEKTKAIKYAYLELKAKSLNEVKQKQQAQVQQTTQTQVTQPQIKQTKEQTRIGVNPIVSGSLVQNIEKGQVGSNQILGPNIEKEKQQAQQPVQQQEHTPYYVGTEGQYSPYVKYHKHPRQEFGYSCAELFEKEKKRQQEIQNQRDLINQQIQQSLQLRYNQNPNVQQQNVQVQQGQQMQYRQNVAQVQNQQYANNLNQKALNQYKAQVEYNLKPSLWQRFKESKFVKAVKYLFNIRVVLEIPNALPEGKS